MFALQFLKKVKKLKRKDRLAEHFVLVEDEEAFDRCMDREDNHCILKNAVFTTDQPKIKYYDDIDEKLVHEEGEAIYQIKGMDRSLNFDQIRFILFESDAKYERDKSLDNEEEHWIAKVAPKEYKGSHLVWSDGKLKYIKEDPSKVSGFKNFSQYIGTVIATYFSTIVTVIVLYYVIGGPQREDLLRRRFR